MMTLYMDQISEHQRDLTNSACSRFIPELVAAVVAVTERLVRVCRRLGVNPVQMKENFLRSKEMVIAEPLYVLLAAHGHPDAHEVVRRLTLVAERTGRSLRAVVEESEELIPYLDRMSERQREVLRSPELYVGIAGQKALRVADHWETTLQLGPS